MKRIKKFLRDRRGVAIEFAIGAMLLTVAVSTILLTTAVKENAHRTRDLEEFEAMKIQLRAEEYFNDVVINNLPLGVTPDKPDKYEDFRCKKTEDGNLVTVEITYEGNVVLTITYDSTTNEVVSWK